MGVGKGMMDDAGVCEIANRLVTHRYKRRRTAPEPELVSRYDNAETQIPDDHLSTTSFHPDQAAQSLHSAHYSSRRVI